MSHRFVVVGAGAIGGVVAVGLVEAGHDVVVVARGAHLVAIRAHGLRRVDADGESTVDVDAHADVRSADVHTDDVVLLATKVHQAESVLDELLAVAGPGLRVATLQNGVDGERLALRRFRDVQAVLVNVPAVHLEPGVVEVHARTPRGLLDVGLATGGLDATSHLLTNAFSAAGFVSEATEQVMRRKWAKLAGNVGNALQVLCGTDRAAWWPLYEDLRAEALAVFAAAGIDPDVETQQARAAMVARADIGGRRRPGGSTWQSVVRGTGSVETAALNGEVVLQAHLHGTGAPLNSAVHALTRQVVDGNRVPGGTDVAEIRTVAASL